MERMMTKRSREKINMTFLDACLLVAEDGQRPDAGEFIGYGSRNPAAREQPQCSLLGRRGAQGAQRRQRLTRSARRHPAGRRHRDGQPARHRRHAGPISGDG